MNYSKYFGTIKAAVKCLKSRFIDKILYALLQRSLRPLLQLHAAKVNNTDSGTLNSTFVVCSAVFGFHLSVNCDCSTCKVVQQTNVE